MLPKHLMSSSTQLSLLNLHSTIKNTPPASLNFYLFLTSGTELGIVLVVISVVIQDLTQPTHVLNAHRMCGIKL